MVKRMQRCLAGLPAVSPVAASSTSNLQPFRGAASAKLDRIVQYKVAMRQAFCTASVIAFVIFHDWSQLSCVTDPIIFHAQPTLLEISPEVSHAGQL
jgi:hypothetical protein